MGKKFYSIKVWLYAFHISIGFFIFGYTDGVFNTCQESVSAYLHWGNKQQFFIALFSTILLIGQMLGAMTAGQISKKLGRRLSLQISLVINFIGCGIVAIPYTQAFGISRFLTGFSVGLLSSICPLFISEIAPKQISGKLGTFLQLLYTFGLFVSYAMGLPLPISNYDQDSFIIWLIFMFAFTAIFDLYLFLILQFRYVHDSPYWLNQYGKKEFIQNALKEFYTQEGKKEMIQVLEQKSIDQLQFSLSSREYPTLKKIYTKKRYRKMLRLTLVLNILQDWCGMDTIIYYSTAIFSDFGGGVFISRVYTVIFGFFNMLATLITIPLVDRVGRKILIVAGCASITVIFSILFVVEYFLDLGTLFSVMMIFLFVIAFECSLGPIVWLYIGEIAHEKVMAIGASTNAFMSISLVMMFPYIVQYIGIYFSFIIFAGVTFCGAIYAYFDMMETKGIDKQRILTMISTASLCQELNKDEF